MKDLVGIAAHLELRTTAARSSMRRAASALDFTRKSFGATAIEHREF